MQFAPPFPYMIGLKGEEGLLPFPLSATAEFAGYLVAVRLFLVTYWNQKSRDRDLSARDPAIRASPHPSLYQTVLAV